jgi:PleD family two-component response regulator
MYRFWYYIVLGDYEGVKMEKAASNQSHEMDTSPGSDKLSVLLVGHAAAAIADSEQVAKFGHQQCEDMAEAITLATQQRFDRIFVVLSSFAGRLESALQSLRRASEDSAIIILAQMYEEPKARRLVRSPRSPRKPADDYLICPVNIRWLGNGTKSAETAQLVPKPSLVRRDYKDERIRELEKLATEDDLTGLKNRRYVREFLRQIIERAKAEDLRVTLFLFDIDNFKHYNDTYGHAVGDVVLRQAAVMMRKCCRAHDVISRIGGDEFAVIFWDLPSDHASYAPVPEAAPERRGAKVGHPQEAFLISERFRKEISSVEFSFLGSEGKGVLTISGGLASFSSDGMTAEELLEQADRAMLEAKRSGKNRIYLIGKPK